jgi:hydrogenase maturation protease
MRPVRTLIIGCGNLLRGDDGAGPELIRRLKERGLPDDVGCVDAGTDGMAVALRMRGVSDVVLVDACRSGNEAGTLFNLSAEDVERLPPHGGVSIHDVRWNDALAFGRLLVGGQMPRATAWLIEAANFELGASLSPAVDRAVDELADLLSAHVDPHRGGIDVTPPADFGNGCIPTPCR